VITGVSSGIIERMIEARKQKGQKRP